MNQRHRRATKAWLLRALMLLLIGVSPAAAQRSGESASTWQFSLTPYLWLAGVSGDVALPRQSRDFDAEFGDILSDLQFGAMGFFEARRGRFGLLVDGLTLITEQDVSTPRGLLFRGGSTRLTATELSMIGLVRVVETPSWDLDLGAGLRSWWIDAKVSLNHGMAAARSASGSTGILDPVLALRHDLRLSEQFGLTTYADIGGFGTGSRLTWQVLGALRWQVTESTAANVGYRHMAIDLSRGAVDLDVALSGPIMGVSFRF
ncbi:hypothetical protein [Falsiroseomonas sp. E2-1-a20]|uniref:hypothetical protein n=1 Tax=Falsiroseomonas sp. E2-1-a20 TaxID=3239300 RepID=UPI003F2F50D4